jgi:hypothetical protein
MADQSFQRYLQGGTSQSFNPYGAGNKIYGGGRSAPNIGPVSNREGYDERDRKAKLMRQQLLKRMQAGQSGRFMSSAWQTPRGNFRG